MDREEGNGLQRGGREAERKVWKRGRKIGRVKGIWRHKGSSVQTNVRRQRGMLGQRGMLRGKGREECGAEKKVGQRGRWNRTRQRLSESKVGRNRSRQERRGS